MNPMPAPREHIHFIAICGVGMASLAGLLQARGYRISGSDENIYPPMSSYLEHLGIPICQGYAAEHVGEPDLVVVGNAVSRHNLEVQWVLQRGIPYISLPQALGKFLVGTRRSIVVAGTHGKTTTTSLLAWVLVNAGLDPSVFVGGLPINLANGFRSGAGPWVVLEGDEYDSAFFDKGPKFLHYKPERVILTSVEFDHADIYRDLAHIKTSFKKLMELIPQNGSVVACNEYSEVKEVARTARCPVQFYGSGEPRGWEAHDLGFDGLGMSFSPGFKGKREGVVTLPLMGRHNATNALAVYAMAREIGLSAEAVIDGMVSFKGVRRRQEVKGESGGVVVIDDFAHHPTAIQDTIAAVRGAYPGRRVWAVFEPRSQTSRRKVMAEELATSLAGADRVVLSGLYDAGKIPAEERLAPEELVERINAQRNGNRAAYLEQPRKIVSLVAGEALNDDVILVMSNGIFDHMADQILNALKLRNG